MGLLDPHSKDSVLKIKAYIKITATFKWNISKPQENIKG
jgi:hypothetical protein